MLLGQIDKQLDDVASRSQRADPRGQQGPGRQLSLLRTADRQHCRGLRQRRAGATTAASSSRIAGRVRCRPR